VYALIVSGCDIEAVSYMPRYPGCLWGEDKTLILAVSGVYFCGREGKARCAVGILSAGVVWAVEAFV